MAPPAAQNDSPEFKPKEFKKDIPLVNIEEVSGPPSYHSSMAPPARASKADTSAQRRNKDADASPEQTQQQLSEKVLLDHVLAQRSRQRARRRDPCDRALDCCIFLTQTLTVLGLIFMFVWTIYKWVHLGPHYAKDFVLPPSESLSSRINAD